MEQKYRWKFYAEFDEAGFVDGEFDDGVYLTDSYFIGTDAEAMKEASERAEVYEIEHPSRPYIGRIVMERRQRPHG